MREPGYETEPAITAVPAKLGARAALLIGASLLLAAAFVLYVLYARGLFEPTQRLTLVADSVEGVSVGMDLTYAGFPIGRVRRIALAEDGKARIEIDVARRDAHWLRRSSVFTLEVTLFGATRLRAYTGDFGDARLEDGAQRPVLRGDTSEEIPRMVASARQVLEHLERVTGNVERMTGPESSLQESLRNVRLLSERMAGRTGLLGAALGSEDEARKLIAAIGRAGALVGRLEGAALQLERALAKADERLFGTGGIAEETQRAAQQAVAILAEVRARLASVDAILANAQAASAGAASAAANVAAASTDLAALRAEVEASLRKVAALIEEIHRRWPFERDTRLRLP
jgi:phospholipid/cholesterol/gamma-HCH transport system substrate-binding protein